MDIGELVISLRLRTEALERGLTDTQRRLRDQERATREAAAGQRELQSAFTKTAAVAAVAFAGIVAAVMSGVKAHNEYRSAIVGLKSVADGTGNDMATLQKAVDGLTKDGLIPATAAATGLKNLLSRGFSDIEAVEILTRFKDAAAFGRQASLSLGDAVRSATEGIKNENSILVDNAGVTKNVSVMWKEYAESIGVGVQSLTLAQKRQAEYNGIMNETRFQVGDAAKYSAEFAGQQAALSAQTGLLSEAFGASMIPLLSAFASILQPILLFLTEWTKRNPELVSTITTMAAALAALVAVIGGVIAAKLAWAAASKALGVALGTLMLNPVILGLTALTGVVALLTFENAKAKQATLELKQAQEEYQKVVERGIEKNEIAATQEKIKKLDEMKEKYQELIEVANQLEEAEKKLSEVEKNRKNFFDAMKSGDIMSYFDDFSTINFNDIIGAELIPDNLYKAAEKLGINLRQLESEAMKFDVQLKFIDKNGKLSAESLDQLNEVTKNHAKAVREASLATTAEVNESAKQVAMNNREVLTIQNLLKQYSSAKKGTSEWSNAQKQLSDMFPQFSTAVGINEDAIRGLTIIKQQEVATAWASVQVKANEIVMEKKRELSVREAAIAAVEAGAKWLFGMDNAAGATRLAREEVEKLKGEIVALQAIGSMDPSQVAGVPVIEAPTVKEPKSTAYKNEALDNAIKLMEHRKKINQLTLEDELKTLEQIQSKNVKTADERMQIEERIFDVKQQLSDKTLEVAMRDYDRAKTLGKLSENDEIVRLERIKKLYADSADERESLDDMIFDAKQRKKEAEKQFEEDVLSETTRLYKEAAEDRLLKEELTAEERYEIQRKTFTQTVVENKAYLEEVLADDKYTAKEKERIQKEITSVIRQNLNEQLQFEKDHYAQIRQQNIDSINDLSKGIQSALRNKYEDEKTEEENRIKGLLDSNEQWKKDATDIAKDTYDARLKAAQASADAELALIDQVYGAQIKAIQDELAALEQAEKQKSRAELDADDATRIARLQAKIEHEHDEFNKAALNKELNKVIADQSKRHEAEQLADKKESLKTEEQILKDKLAEQTTLIKDQLAEKKEMLEDDRDSEISRINSIAEATKNSLNSQLAATQAHYAKLLAAKALQAEAEKLIIDNQQKEIITLLEGFGDAYQITGQTLGEKMYEGFKGKVMQITTLIDQINRQIDAARNAAMAVMAMAGGGYSGTSSSGVGVGAAVASSVSVVNNFNSPVTSPSDVSRAATKTAQQLAIG